MDYDANLPSSEEALIVPPADNSIQPEVIPAIPSKRVPLGFILLLSVLVIVGVSVYFVAKSRTIQNLINGAVGSGQNSPGVTTSFGKIIGINVPTPEPSAASIITTPIRQSTVGPTFNPTPSLSTVTPTATPRPTSTPAPTPTSTPTPTPTPIPPDTQAPTVTIQGGPAQDQTVDFSNLCFPLYITDNRSVYPNLWVRTKLDNSNWTDWTTNVAPCYNNLGNGQHTFVVQGKDQAGNVSAEQYRYFNVDVFSQGIMAGTVFLDANGDGNLESSEGISFSSINLYKNGSSSPIASQATGVDGKFSFSNLLAGSYTVKAEDTTGKYIISGLNYATVDLSRSNPTVNTIAFEVVLK